MSIVAISHCHWNPLQKHIMFINWKHTSTRMPCREIFSAFGCVQGSFLQQWPSQTDACHNRVLVCTTSSSWHVTWRPHCIALAMSDHNGFNIFFKKNNQLDIVLLYLSNLFVSRVGNHVPSEICGAGSTRPHSLRSSSIKVPCSGCFVGC